MVRASRTLGSLALATAFAAAIAAPAMAQSAPPNLVAGTVTNIVAATSNAPEELVLQTSANTYVTYALRPHHGTSMPS